MRFNFATAAVLALGAQSVAASTWFSKAAYNKWHETELERWLSDHDVPYPTPADRKDLVDLVKNNWEDNVASPYNSWDTNQLQNYLSTQGQKAKKGTEKNKDSLVSQVKQYWHETADQASDSYSSVQNWIFDSWTDSQLKAFLDYHHVPNPSPRTRDSLLHSARSNYQSVAEKIGETASYPGNWLYESWSDSDLKAWLDERGIPAPQSSSRDKLVASIRRNARTASDKAASAASSASSSAAGAQQSLSDQLLDAWSDSQLKSWFDKNGIKVPQGSKRNELVALARKHSAKLSGDNISASASSAYGAASSNAGNVYDAASKSAGSVYGDASKSAGSVYGDASKSAGSQYGKATGAAAQATDSAYGSAQYWMDWAKAQIGIGGEEAKSSLASVSSVASASASSASSVASKSSSSLSSAGSKSATSASSDASASASSASKSASKSGSGYAQQAADAVSENASSAKHKASEAAQKATDRVKEEL